MSTWIDITAPLQEGIPQWPGDPVFRMWTVSNLDEGARVSAFSMCAHTGTHIDAPAHYLEGGASISAAPLDLLIGPAVVATFDGAWQGAARVLFRTSSSDHQWWHEPFREDFPAITPNLARQLAASGVKLVGIDYLSVGRNGAAGSEVHRILLGAGIWLLEGLNLCEAPLGHYELVCLPLRLIGADGAPARALLRPATTSK